MRPARDPAEPWEAATASVPPAGTTILAFDAPEAAGPIEILISVVTLGTVPGVALAQVHGVAVRAHPTQPVLFDTCSVHLDLRDQLLNGRGLDLAAYDAYRAAGHRSHGDTPLASGLRQLFTWLAETRVVYGAASRVWVLELRTQLPALLGAAQYTDLAVPRGILTALDYATGARMLGAPLPSALPGIDETIRCAFACARFGNKRSLR